MNPHVLLLGVFRADAGGWHPADAGAGVKAQLETGKYTDNKGVVLWFSPGEGHRGVRDVSAFLHDSAVNNNVVVPCWTLPVEYAPGVYRKIPVNDRQIWSFTKEEVDHGIIYRTMFREGVEGSMNLASKGLVWDDVYAYNPTTKTTISWLV